jgi:hypothetical protein
MARLVLVFGIVWLLSFLCYTAFRSSTLKQKLSFAKGALVAILTASVATAVLAAIVICF